MKPILINRNTMVLGIAMILMAIVPVVSAIFDGDSGIVPNYQFALTEIIAGIGLIFARDGGKTSAQGA